MELKSHEEVYSPREDSFLLQRVVSNLCILKKPNRVLDLGTGSGIQAITAKLSGAKKVVAVDINPKAIMLAKQNVKLNKVEIEFHTSDLFNHVNGNFDMIIFNPPYLPMEPPIDIQWSGGREFIEDFVRQAKDRLNEGGIIVFVYSSLDPIKIHHRIVAKETMPDGEILYVATVQS